MMNAADERGHDGLTSVERIKEMMLPILLDWGHECTAALRAELSAAEARERVLREALDGMEAPITFSEAEQSVTLPMGMERFIEIVDFANLILARRVVINRKRTALATPAQPQTGGKPCS